ncbi:Legionella pneumophila major outer membrane protein precursor [Leptolyngbyaceae cyanobacterium JSC-12]|nr:Legionella pneumophila major outer membrane protein precursor [Leptolyngbyaceae cyanobacterium JSC-12]
MLKNNRVSLAVAIATVLSSSMTAIAQEYSELEDPQSPNQAIPDPDTNSLSDTPTSYHQAAVESSSTVEFSQAPYAREFEQRSIVVQAEPSVDPPIEAVSAPSVPVSYQPQVAQPIPAAKPAEIAKPIQVAQVVVPTVPATTISDRPAVVPTHPLAAQQPETHGRSPVSAVETRPTIEFSQASKAVPVSTVVVDVDAVQTQTPVTPPLLPQGTPDSVNPVQTQLQQLQQQQRQLQQQINNLQRQMQPQPNGSVVVVKDNNPSNLRVTGEALFWNANPADAMDYAIADPGTALATSGDLKTVDYDNGTGFRLGAIYRLPNSGWDLGGNYTNFNTQGSSSAVAPANGFLFSTRSHPFQNETADTAAASAKLNYKAGDFEAGYNIRAGKNVDLRLFGGLKASNLNQKMNINYDGRDYTNGQIDTENNFTGVGPRVGLEAKVPLGAGFNLFGRGAASMQVGTQTSTFRETDRNGADVIADLRRQQKGQVVPGLELAAGLSWEKQLSKQAKIEIGGGYELQHLFNVTDNVRFVDAASPGVFAQNKGDLSLKGFFLKGGVSIQF